MEKRLIMFGNGNTDWKVLYEDKDNGYVFIICDPVYSTTLEGTVTVSSLSQKQLDLYDIFRLGNTQYELSDYAAGEQLVSNQAVAALIAGYGAYANTEDYGNYVVGSIGAPTIELLAAGYNAKYGVNAINPIVALDYDVPDTTGMYGHKGVFGYYLNERGNLRVYDLQGDDLYVYTGQIDGAVYNPERYTTWVATPSAFGWFTNPLCTMAVCYTASSDNASIDCVCVGTNSGSPYIRPVVCLKSSIPAEIGTATNYSLKKVTE